MTNKVRACANKYTLCGKSLLEMEEKMFQKIQGTYICDHDTYRLFRSVQKQGRRFRKISVFWREMPADGTGFVNRTRQEKSKNQRL